MPEQRTRARRFRTIRRVCLIAALSTAIVAALWIAIGSASYGIGPGKYLDSSARVAAAHVLGWWHDEDLEAAERLRHGLRFGVPEHGIPDMQTAWYNRNLRIFQNLQRITEGPGERILLVIGAGHVPIIRHAVISSPEYELVEVDQLIRAK